MTKTYLKRETAQARAYSQAVITDGGRIIWLAGQTAGAEAAEAISTVRSAESFPGWQRRSRRRAAR